jgi:hypothetical protein
MNRAYSTHGRDEKFIQNFSKNLKKRYYLEDLGADNIEIDLKEIGWEGVDLIYFRQDRDQ